MASALICLRVKGSFDCFTRPEFHVERVSYPAIRPSTARGILEAILMKPIEKGPADAVCQPAQRASPLSPRTTR